MVIHVLLLSLLVSVGGPPRLVLGDGLRLCLPESLLEDRVFRQHLTSGLTLSLVLECEDRTGRSGSVLVDIRFEPWDEVFFVRLAGDGLEPRDELHRDRSVLDAWLTEVGIPLPSTLADEGDLGVRLSILPFSAREQERARRWVRVREPDPQNANASNQGSDVLADLLITGSIRRSSMRTYRWRLTVP